MTLTVNMQASLTEEDRRTFGFDMRGLHWPTYLDIYCQVSKQHLILDPKNNVVILRVVLDMAGMAKDLDVNKQTLNFRKIR